MATYSTASPAKSNTLVIVTLVDFSVLFVALGKVVGFWAGVSG